MNIVVDIGNTLCKIGYFENQNLTKRKEIPSRQPEAISDALLKNASKKNSIIISSVSVIPQNIENILKQYKISIHLDCQTPVPIKNLYKTPKTLGPDRIALSCGATKIFPLQNTLIISCGTCLTYDFIDYEHKYRGGAISPGLKMRLRALHTFTKKLPLIEIESQPELIGQCTMSSISSGVFYGILHEVEGAIKKYKQQFSELAIILTGGDYLYFDKIINYNIFAQPNLLLEGLNEILNYNA